MTSRAATSAAPDAPVGPRSERVDQMLDAAAELLAVGGYSQVTTTAVAARAGVSVGSLHTTFPDRDAVLRELARRSFERFTRVMAERLARHAVRDLPQMVEVMVDAYVDFASTEPSTRALSFGGAFERRILDPDGDADGHVARALGRLLLVVRPDLELDDRLLTVLRVAVEATDGVLQLALARHPEPDLVIVAHAKQLLRAHLGLHIAD